MAEVSASYKLILISVMVIYLSINLFAGLWASKRQQRGNGVGGKGFVNDYFIGGRSMGGLVLAMTLIATFTSASSFIGGPGTASARGLVWAYLSMIQVPTAFIILGILGKKFAIIARKTNAVTVTDFLRARYRSAPVVIISSICLVLFFIAQMTSQFLGGAILFQTITGFSYIYGLLLFGAIVILYTTIGGFRAVVVTDTIQGLIMVAGAIILLVTIVAQAGGFEALTAKLQAASPNYADITAGGTTLKPFVLSFWALVGVGVLGLPQTAVRGMGFKDTKSLHSAIIYGTIVVGFLMLAMHVAGAFAPTIIDVSALETTDHVIPQIMLKHMDPVVAGLFIAAPLAAIMSTVSSLLILASAAIVKDIYLNYIVEDEQRKVPGFDEKISGISMFATLIVGLIVMLFAVRPPSAIVWINLFAMGGLECAFFCPILFGLYWRKANATGAITSSIAGVACFLGMSAWNDAMRMAGTPERALSLFGTTPIVPSIIVSVLAFIIFSFVGKETDQEVLDVFYPERS